MGSKLKSLFILTIGLALAYWFISRVEWRIVGSYLRNARIWPLILGAILINLTILIRSLRWKVFLAPIALVSFHNLVAATAVGFGGLFVIGRAGSEIIRPAVLSLREKLQPSATLATILIERIFDTCAVVFLFAVSLLFFDGPREKASFFEKLGGAHRVGLFIIAGLLAGITVLVLLRVKAPWIIGRLERSTTKLPQKLIRPILNFVRHLADGLTVLLNARELLISILLTCGVWGMVSTATWLSIYAFGIKLGIMQVFFILGFGLVGSVIPTPGGSAGAFHAAAAKGLEFQGLEPNLAASAAIIYHLIAFGPPFILALYYLIRDDISIHQLREMIASENA